VIHIEKNAARAGKEPRVGKFFEDAGERRAYADRPGRRAAGDQRIVPVGGCIENPVKRYGRGKALAAKGGGRRLVADICLRCVGLRGRGRHRGGIVPGQPPGSGEHAQQLFLRKRLVEQGFNRRRKVRGSGCRDDVQPVDLNGSGHKTVLLKGKTRSGSKDQTRSRPESKEQT